MTVHWNWKIERLLKQWVNEFLILENIHKIKGVQYSRWNVILGIGNMLLMSGLFVSTLNNIFSRPNYITFIIQLIIEIIGIVLAGVDKYVNFSTTSEKHLNASLQYASLSRLIYSTLTLNTQERMNPQRLLSSIQEQYYEISRNSPKVNIEKINQLKHQFTITPNAQSNIQEENILSQTINPIVLDPDINNQDILTTHTSSSREYSNQDIPNDEASVEINNKDENDNSIGVVVYNNDDPDKIENELSNVKDLNSILNEEDEKKMKQTNNNENVNNVDNDIPIRVKRGVLESNSSPIGHKYLNKKSSYKQKDKQTIHDVDSFDAMLSFKENFLKERTHPSMNNKDLRKNLQYELDRFDNQN